LNPWGNLAPNGFIFENCWISDFESPKSAF
jgi:hypothetical protein